MIWRETQYALITLARQWKERFQYVQQASPGKEHIPPVMIIVCDNTGIAELFHKNISGKESLEVEAEEGDEEENGARRRENCAKS